MNQSKNLSSTFFDLSLSSSLCGLSIIAQSAGVSVKATNADKAIETAIVSANCLYKTPVIPPRNATGTKTAASTHAIATTGPCTSSIARSVASTGCRPSFCRWYSTFSITTIASSTTSPMAKTIAKSVNVFIVKSSTWKAASVPISETGTASKGMSVARQLCRKMNITSTTSANASKNVSSTSFMEARMYCVLSTTSMYFISGGKFNDASFITSRTLDMVCIALASFVS